MTRILGSEGDGGAWRRRTVLKSIGVGLAVPAVSRIGAAAESRTVIDFENNGPENLAVDDDGNLYLTMNFSGEILKLPAELATETGLTPGDATVVATLPIGGGFVTGVDADDGTLYVALDSFDGNHGIWEVSVGSGASSLFAPITPVGLPNGVLVDPGRNRLLVTDSFRGLVLRVDLAGGGVSTWVDDGLLDPSTFIGANGLAFDRHGDLFVTNSDAGRIVRIPVERDGSAGTPETYVEDSALVGADGLTFHNGRTLYVAVNGQNTVVRVTPSGRIATVVDERDGLDFPADVEFGTAPRTRGKLFVANFGFNGDPQAPAISGDPSLMRTHP